MDTLLATAALFLIFLFATYYVLVPLLSVKEKPVSEDEADRTIALELRKVNLFKQIREAEFEREMGLINEEDFDRTKTDLLAEVAEVMHELDSVPGNHNPPENGTAISDCPSCGAPIVPGTRYCSNCGTAVGDVCPGCGATVSSGDRFCASCGRGLLN
ncbi:MAG: zinc ribbon domain-containing protein [Fidelibacterota bacterium]|nr:MAG: zinc ribbon domain-containing protein [Candidatus Neomarinimicrobiota bacterium]